MKRFPKAMLLILLPILTAAAYFLILYFNGSKTVITGKSTPQEGKTMMIIGQDLESVRDYVKSGYFPKPAGITSYVNLYNLDGLQGENDANWGAGPINTQKALDEFPDSVMVMGLYMTEYYSSNSLTAITKGNYDEQINTLARFIKNANRPVFLRIGYEFDGEWNHFDPEKYKNAFRYIVDKIRPVTGNLVTVWQASASPINLIGRKVDIIDISPWYPGDEYVDWCGLSWFLSADKRQVNLADDVLKLARKHDKPVMICESTPQGYDLKNLTKKNITPVLDGPSGRDPVSKTPDQIWKEWFEPYFKYIHKNSDVIRAAAYINANWDVQRQWSEPYGDGYWGDSRVQVNSTIREKWVKELSSEFWVK